MFFSFSPTVSAGRAARHDERLHVLEAFGFAFARVHQERLGAAAVRHEALLAVEHVAAAFACARGSRARSASKSMFGSISAAVSFGKLAAVHSGSHLSFCASVP